MTDLQVCKDKEDLVQYRKLDKDMQAQDLTQLQPSSQFWKFPYFLSIYLEVETRVSGKPVYTEQRQKKEKGNSAGALLRCIQPCVRHRQPQKT